MRTFRFEELQYFIYEHGVDKVCTLLNITERQIQSSIFGKYQKQIKNEEQPLFTNQKTINQDEHLYLTFSQHYQELYKLFQGCKRKNDIDVTGQDYEDRFHNSFVAIVENCTDFEYESDEKTLSFIKKCLFFHAKREKTSAKRLTKKLIAYDQKAN